MRVSSLLHGNEEQFLVFNMQVIHMDVFAPSATSVIYVTSLAPRTI